MVGLAGLAPAIPCSQGRCVGYYATARNSCRATGCIRSPSGHDCSLAREVAGTKIGPHGTICTRTGPVLNRMPLLLGYAGDGLHARSCTLTTRFEASHAVCYITRREMERRPGLAPGKNWFANSRLDGFGMRRIDKVVPAAGFAPALSTFSTWCLYLIGLHREMVPERGIEPRKACL